MGPTTPSAPVPAVISTTIVASTQYATDDSASAVNTGSARNFGRSVCSISSERRAGPSSTRFTRPPTPSRLLRPGANRWTP